jgi:hypothetical protein
MVENIAYVDENEFKDINESLVYYSVLTAVHEGSRQVN